MKTKFTHEKLKESVVNITVEDLVNSLSNSHSENSWSDDELQKIVEDVKKAISIPVEYYISAAIDLVLHQRNSKTSQSKKKKTAAIV
jgi:hypothetical protein